MLTNFIRKINVIFITNNLVVSENCANTHSYLQNNSRIARNIYPFSASLQETYGLSYRLSCFLNVFIVRP